MPIDISNVLFYCDACQKGVRVGMKFRDDGSKVRFCKKCGKEAGVVSPANPKYAAAKGT
jgi:large subunit ribosomal protein L24